MNTPLKRTKQVIIRVTNQEYLQLLTNCNRPRLATWIRETCLNKATNTKPARHIDKNLLASLGRLNGNMNQIAKYINSQNKIQKQIDIIKVLAELALIRSSLDSLLDVQYADKNIQK